MMRLHPEDIQGKELCYLLTVEYLGKPYRFSTIPIDIQDPATGQLHRYNGGLGDPSIEQQTEIVGFNIDSNTVSLELVFDDVDWIAEWLANRTLEQSPAVLSMVMVSDGKTTFTEQDKVPLFAGKVIDPIIGTPTKPKGNIIFSIENGLNVTKRKLLANSFEIDPFVFPGLDQRAATLGRMIQYPVGKYVPFVFGALGAWFIRDTSKSYEVVKDAKVTPTYIIDTSGSGASLAITLILAMGEVDAGRITIYDQDGGYFTDYVRTATNADGILYSYATYQSGSVLVDNGFVPALDEDQTFWASWANHGEGSQDPITGQSLNLAGNLCIYILELTGLQFNRSAWEGLRPVLNRYKFAGYVNDPEVIALEWLQDNLIKYLPIEVFNGPAGLEPRLNLYYQSEEVNPSFYITESGMFDIVTGLQPLSIEPINKVTVKFCYEGQNNHYLSTIVIDPTVSSKDVNPFLAKDPVSDLSYSRFGLRETVLELPFVWDMNTAYRIARDVIRISGLGAYGIEISAFPAFGYLEVGDVIAFTSSQFGLNEHKCQVVSKSWTNGKSRFILHLESNPLVNPRLV